MKNSNAMLTIIISIVSLFYSCETPAGFPGISEDIEDSKKRGVYICEYIVKPNPYYINDSLHITVKEAWLERHWAHGKTKDITLLYPEPSYQLCINMEESEKDLKGIGFDWYIGIDFEKNMRTCGDNSLVSDFKTVPGDTIEYKVQKGEELSDNYEKIIIGEFVLFKKK